ncbi:hypothetical protein LIER_25593 [Lithospermum erythrorhizon]|uniref:Uncharacterized protein n=1 Tax=Lithospermum erythrorhizon TaxID=34254 RepID=A0AAV3R9N9_LITER
MGMVLGNTIGSLLWVRLNGGGGGGGGGTATAAQRAANAAASKVVLIARTLPFAKPAFTEGRLSHTAKSNFA